MTDKKREVVQAAKTFLKFCTTSAGRKRLKELNYESNTVVVVFDGVVTTSRLLEAVARHDRFFVALMVENFLIDGFYVTGRGKAEPFHE